MAKRILLVFLGVMLSSCSQDKNRVTGGIYAVPDDRGYRLIKILKVDDTGVHIRMYSNLIEKVPENIDEAELFMAPPDNKEGLPFGMGHAPISHNSFDAWGAVYIQKTSVTDDELEGYKIWKEAGGGYF